MVGSIFFFYKTEQNKTTSQPPKKRKHTHTKTNKQRNKHAQKNPQTIFLFTNWLSWERINLMSASFTCLSGYEHFLRKGPFDFFLFFNFFFFKAAGKYFVKLSEKQSEGSMKGEFLLAFSSSWLIQCTSDSDVFVHQLQSPFSQCDLAVSSSS